jgi:two-component system cell cycle sensor histidine kinase/response regulator CckA
MNDEGSVNHPVKILYVEDSKADFELVEHSLKSGGVDCDIHCVDTRAGLVEELEHAGYDLVLSDSSLPGFSGRLALQIVRNIKPEVPFIFVSGTMGEDAAIESLHHGATDYVLKSRLSRLVPAVHRALSEAREKSLRQTTQRRLQQARRMEAVGTLAGGLAHDFNNVLTVIKAHMDLLSLYHENPEQRVKIMEKIMKAVDQGSTLTKELLIFGRKTEAQPAFIDVADKVRETASLLKEALPKNVALNLRLAESLSPIFIDPGHLDRILTNLVMNSSDAMPAGGTITISAEEPNLGPAISRFQHDGDEPRLCLKVTDTGHGMNETTLMHLFEPFYTTKSSGKGTGLGLSVVFGLMQIHSGTIDVRSELGRGTSVALYFPLHHDSHLVSEALHQSGVPEYHGP